MKHKRVSHVNFQSELSFEEHRRLTLEFLKFRYALNYEWEGDEVVEYEYDHVGNKYKTVIMKVTDTMIFAKDVFMSLSAEQGK